MFTEITETRGCPFCGSDVIADEAHCRQGDQIKMVVTCVKCKSTWQEFYKLIGYEKLNKGELTEE